VLVALGVAFLVCGLAQWRYGERWNRWALYHLLPRWWPGASWHRNNMDEDWYRILIVRGGALWFVGLGIVALISASVRLVNT
jgi:hypothetical protein